MEKSEVPFVVTGKTSFHLKSMIPYPLTIKSNVEQKVSRYHAVRSLVLFYYVLTILNYLKFASFLFSDNFKVRKTRVK